MELKNVVAWVLSSHRKEDVSLENVNLTHESEDAIHCEYDKSGYEIYFGDNSDYPTKEESATIVELIDKSDQTLYPYIYQ